MSDTPKPPKTAETDATAQLPAKHSIAAILARLRAREISCGQLCRSHLDRIDESNATLGAFLTVDREAAFAAARRIDQAMLRGQPMGALAGVPVAIKDNIVTRGMATTAGSRVLAGYLPPYDAEVVRRLRAAGAIILGKTNLDEFGMGSSTERSAYGPTRNPVDSERIPGGSSGGSAAAVAAGLVPMALGSDTGGSIRQPAALCGVVGLKPTWGRVSRRGLVAYASSLDQVGPIGRCVRDCATTLRVIAGADPGDATTSEAEVPDYLVELENGVAGLRIGVPEAFFGDGLAPAVEAQVRKGLERLAKLGAELCPIALPDPRHALAAYYVIAPAEASSNLARFDGVRYGQRQRGKGLSDMYENTRGAGFGPEVKRRILLGTYALSAGYYEAFYGRAQRVRAQIRAGFTAALQRCDVICTPTSPVVAPKLGEVQDPLAMMLMDVYTIAANLAGIPALSVPCGTASGLPVGLQIMGRAWDEATILRTGQALEATLGADHG